MKKILKFASLALITTLPCLSFAAYNLTVTNNTNKEMTAWQLISYGKLNGLQGCSNYRAGSLQCTIEPKTSALLQLTKKGKSFHIIDVSEGAGITGTEVGETEDYNGINRILSSANNPYGITLDGPASEVIVDTSQAK